MSTALIIGVSGQDGTYLARLLLGKGYNVIGTSRFGQDHSFSNLIRLGIRDKIHVAELPVTDLEATMAILKNYRPDEIYNLSSQSSVGRSFYNPLDTYDSNCKAVLILLEALRRLEIPVKCFNASSSEIFGETPSPADETTPLRPCSPYGAAKAAAFWTVANYRDNFGIPVCSGILFPHESPLRPASFVTRKVVDAALRISRGSKEKLKLGFLGVQRDWGWAEEYVEAAWRMLQSEHQKDLVIATGECRPLATFVERAFDLVGLDWREHVVIDASLRRPSDILVSQGDPSLAMKSINWKAKVSFNELVKELVLCDGSL